MPVDHLFRSLAHWQHDRAIGIVLSGGGSDGSLGLKEISAAEGITFAQDQASATHDLMPRNAVQSGCVDFVLSPEAMAAELVRIAPQPIGRDARDVAARGAEDGGTIARVFTMLRQLTAVDFSLYKPTTINRRIRRRMVLRKVETLGAYVKHLENNPEELQALYQDFLIGVTSFFRDPAAFQTLRDLVLPRLLETLARDSPLRIWVAGCATGEEVYSVAITVLELLGDNPGEVGIKILASDINESALEKARQGIYLENIELDVSPERLRRFFVKSKGFYRINKAVRDLCVFSRHNLVSDPPFSHVDLITCRNLLIYFDLGLQKRSMPRFHYSLNPGGYLMLGTSETVGTFTDFFELVDEKQKIYKRKAKLYLGFPLEHDRYGMHSSSGTNQQGPKGIEKSPPLPTLPALHKEADRLTLQEFGPPGVIVDENLDIVQFRGQTGAFLEHQPGTATLNLLRMARDGLLIELRGLFTEVTSKKGPVVRTVVLARSDGGYRTLNLHATPLNVGTSAPSQYFLILFEEEAQSEPSSPAPPVTMEVAQSEQREQYNRTQQELEATRELLQEAIEEHESSSEEFRSANEEILSSNEELQSTNEELQLAKEELQSTNEELITVNEAVQVRNRELANLNDDLVNFLAGVNLPFIIVNRDLRIRKITPTAEKVFNVIPTDLGRSIDAIRPNLNLPNLERIILEVIETLTSREIEAQDRQGKWYSVRIVPYITEGKQIEGASIVAFDIDPLKRSLEQARLLVKEQAARFEAESASRAKDEFLAMLAHELRNPLAVLTSAIEIIALQAGNSDELPRMVKIARRHARNLSRMLEDLLDVSRISQGKIHLQKEPVALATLLDRVLEAMQQLCKTTGHHLESSVPPELPWLEVDPVRFEQVMVNLLNNAIKYTEPSGQILLSVALAKGNVELRVKDSGIGIAAEVLPHIFELFSQGERALTRSQGGLGIGLTLVKRLVELHGGTVEAYSAGPGKGTEFMVRLPTLPPDFQGTEKSENSKRSHAAEPSDATSAQAPPTS